MLVSYTLGFEQQHIDWDPVPCYFEQPNEFVPERWYSKGEMVQEKRAFMPFNQGMSDHLSDYYAPCS